MMISVRESRRIELTEARHLIDLIESSSAVKMFHLERSHVIKTTDYSSEVLSLDTFTYAQRLTELIFSPGAPGCDGVGAGDAGICLH